MHSHDSPAQQGPVTRCRYRVPVALGRVSTAEPRVLLLLLQVVQVLAYLMLLRHPRDGSQQLRAPVHCTNLRMLRGDSRAAPFRQNRVQQPAGPRPRAGTEKRV